VLTQQKYVLGDWGIPYTYIAPVSRMRGLQVHLERRVHTQTIKRPSRAHDAMPIPRTEIDAGMIGKELGHGSSVVRMQFGSGRACKRRPPSASHRKGADHR